MAKVLLDAIVYKLNKVSTFDVEILEDFSTNRILDKIYIHPRLKRKKQTEYSTAQRKNSNEKEHKIETIEEILHRERRIVFGGEAGIGKTTLLHWLAITIANHQCNGNLSSWNNKIPFYISLRTVKGLDFPTPEKYIAQIDPDLEHLQPSNWVEQQLKSGRAILLIDGLDELAYEYRTKILDRIESLIYKYPDTRYIMTSRPLVIDQKGRGKWNKWLEQTKFIEFDILEMERTEVEAFIEHWYQIVSPKEQAEVQVSSEHLKKLLWQRNDLYHLATTPLLCSMICALHYELKHQLPTGRLKLYDECIELMLKLRDDTVSLSSAQKRSLLQVLAFRMQRNGESELDRKLVEHIFANELPRLGHVSQEASAVLDYFVQKSGLLREPVLGKIEFIHRTFQDFFAAQELVEEQEFNLLLQQALNPFWRETFPLVSGSMTDYPSELTHLLEQLIQPDKPLEQRTLALACLETSKNVGKELTNYIFKAVAELFPPYRYTDQEALAKVGEAVIPYLVCKEQPNIAAMSACIKVLGKIGGEEALKAIRTYLTIDDKEVRSAINQVWEYFEPKQFAQEFLSKCTEIVIYKPYLLLYLDELIELKSLTIECREFDISLLRHLKKVTKLILSKTKIINISVLAELKELRYLDISQTRVIDISVLAELKELHYLDISDTQVVDISDLAELTELYNLNLSNINIDNEGCEAFSKLEKLEEINLSYTEMSDLNSLYSLNNLRKIVVDLNQFAEKMILSELKFIDDLEIHEVYFDFEPDEIEDLASLYAKISKTNMDNIIKFKNLQKLYVYYENNDETWFLNELNKLDVLNFHGDCVFDFDLLNGNCEFKEISLYVSGIENINLLKSFIKISKLSLQLNGIYRRSLSSRLIFNPDKMQEFDLDIISNMKDLKCLKLRGFNLKNVNLLVGLENLEEIDLHGTPIQDLSLLKQLPNLKRVVLD